MLGALALTWVLIASFDYFWYPENSESGTSWFGVGPPFVLGAFFILSGVVVMFLAARFVKRSKPFFSRKMETVETMVPWEEDPEDRLQAGAADEPPAQKAA